MKIPIKFVFVVLGLIVAGCGGGETTVAPEAQFTRAALTADALRIASVSQTPTLPPASLVATVAAPSPTATLESTPSPEMPTPQATTSAAAPPPAQGGPDNATFVSDVTIPDDTVIAPGDTFKKVWRIRNTGTSTWTSDYSLTYVDGEQFGAPANVPIPNEVSPGEEVEVTVEMTAPETPGSYTSYWKMTTSDGRLFGFGVAGNEAIWVKITVQGALALGTATATGPAGIVSGVSLNIDNAAVVGSCPHTFNFDGQVTLSKSTTLTYVLEVGNQTGDSVKSPPAATQNLPAGAHPVVFELSYPSDFSGWARLHVIAPVDLVSNQVDFSLTCE